MFRTPIELALLVIDLIIVVHLLRLIAHLGGA